MTIKVIFFESALELIPEARRNHPTIRKKWKENIKKKNRGIILDKAIHNPLMSGLEDIEKRGRPDIIYYSILNLIYSPIVQKNDVEIIVHTYTDHCIFIPSNWRIPVNFNRFTGLMSQLLYKKRIPLEGDAILTVSKCSLGKLLEKYENKSQFLLESPSEGQLIINNLDNLLVQDSVFLIGGYQSGDSNFPFHQELLKRKNLQTISLYHDIKPAWMIASKLIHLLEDQLRS